MASGTFMGEPLYSWWRVTAMMLCYTFGELGHFLIGTTSRDMAQDVHFGDLACVTRDLQVEIAADRKCGDVTNQTECAELTSNGSEYCEWNYNGQGIEYQILAGPVFVAVFTVMGIVYGVLGDKYNRVRILSIGVMLYSIMTLVTGFAESYWQLAVLRFFFGAGESACTPLATSIVADSFRERVRGFAMSFFNWGIYFGYGAAFAIGNYVTQADILGLGWRWCYYLAGGPSIVLAVVLFLTVKEPERRNIDQKQEDTGLVEEPSIMRQLGSTLRLYVTTPAILLLLLASCFRHSAAFCWSYNSQLYFDQYYPGTQVGISMALTSIIGGTLGIVAGGWLSDRLAARYGIRTRVWVIATCMLVASLLSIGTLSVAPPYAFVFLLFAYFFAEMWFGVLFTVLVEFFPSASRTKAIAIFIFVINNVGGNAPLIVPPIIQQIGFRQALYLVYPGFYAASSLFFFLAQLAFLRNRPHFVAGEKVCAEKFHTYEANGRKLSKL